MKKEQLKAEGKLLTKKQKEEKKLQERRRQQLLQAGNVSVAGLSKTEEGDAPKPKKVVYTKKNPQNQRLLSKNLFHLRLLSRKTMAKMKLW